ncbi:hypothetical protein GCM10010166_61040 [Couchioplanes caeruleus subsp. azureus]|nr:hypothetical protein GCM10010166_61040 [Couchioplanes caeruleus subsp. azureus]
MVNANWAQAAATAILAVIGLWIAHNYRRQVGLKLVERRIDAYMGLWAILAAASPGRTSPLDRVERQKVRDEMNRWYFDDGNGILMSTPARDLWIAVASNLTCPVASLRPAALAAELASLAEADADRRRGCVCISQASLLRHQMKADLSLHKGLYYRPELGTADRDFLRGCGISPWRRPWRPPGWRARTRASRLSATGASGARLCVCGGCQPAALPPGPHAT